MSRSSGSMISVIQARTAELAFSSILNSNSPSRCQPVPDKFLGDGSVCFIRFNNRCKFWSVGYPGSSGTEALEDLLSAIGMIGKRWTSMTSTPDIKACRPERSALVRRARQSIQVDTTRLDLVFRARGISFRQRFHPALLSFECDPGLPQVTEVTCGIKV